MVYATLAVIVYLVYVPFAFAIAVAAITLGFVLVVCGVWYAMIFGTGDKGGEEDEAVIDVSWAEVCGSLGRDDAYGDVPGDADAGGDEWQHTDTEYESSDRDQEESKISPRHVSEGSTVPSNQSKVGGEKVDSVMKGQVHPAQGVATGSDRGASPKIRTRYSRQS